MTGSIWNKKTIKHCAPMVSAAVLFVGLGFPAIGDEQGPPLTFDSVGSLLQDMDRERDGEDIAYNHSECEAEAMKQRLHETYGRLKHKAVELREVRAPKAVTKPEKVAIKKAHVAVSKAAKQVRSTIGSLKQHIVQADMADRAAMMESAQAALMAAEAALELAP